MLHDGALQARPVRDQRIETEIPMRACGEDKSGGQSEGRKGHIATKQGRSLPSLILFTNLGRHSLVPLTKRAYHDRASFEPIRHNLVTLCDRLYGFFVSAAPAPRSRKARSTASKPW